MPDLIKIALLDRWRQARRPDFERQELAAGNKFVAEALIANKREGLRLAVKARWFALAISAVLIPILNPNFEALYYEAWLLGFALIGWAQLSAGTVGRSGREMFLIFCDIALLTAVFVIPNPLRQEAIPSGFQYHLVEFGYFYIFVAAGTLGYSWRTLSLFALWTVVLWIGALTVQIFFGYYIPELSEGSALLFKDYPVIATIFDPNAFNISFRVQEVVVFLIVVGILMANGRRNNELFYRQVAALQERTNLARHFSPTIVEQLAHQNEPLAEVRSQNVAIMFVDIVGFTRMAESLDPTAMVTLLRNFHSRLEELVFEHQGTLDKFLGDGLMATFGNPAPSNKDADNALHCGQAIIAGFDVWNKERAIDGLQAIKVSVGIHYGSAVLGDIGSERRLEYAVLGDAVNVASRLEALTRSLDVPLIVSNETVQASSQSGSELGFLNLGPQQLKGREEPIEVWGYQTQLSD
jgi:adenylate cyclase